MGAGHNGLVAAAYLATAGLQTIVLERRSTIGGAAVTEEIWPGWKVSTASYVCSLLHPQIIRELYLRAHGFEIYRKEPASFTPLTDGRSLLLGADAAENAREIGRFSRRDVAGYTAFEDEASRLGAALFEHLLDERPRFDALDAATQDALRGSVATLVERYIETPEIAATLATDGLIGTFAGPRDDGTAHVFAHHYAGRALEAQGAWGYVRGGMGAISQALAGAARGAGAEIRTATAVRCFLADDAGRVRGVRLDDGAEVRAGVVLSNADPVTTFSKLGAGLPLDAGFRQTVAGWQCDGISLKINLALGELPQFTSRPGAGVQAHHRATIHLSPALDELQRESERARMGLPSERPMLECFLQTPTDASLAPPGKHLLSIFAQYFPYERSDGPWTDAKREAAADAIVADIARVAPNVPNAIEARQILAPPDLEERFGLHRGHIFHGELLPGQIFERRFAVKTPLAGLFFCGSGTHPGGCVSGAPGLRAARAVQAALEVV